MKTRLAVTGAIATLIASWIALDVAYPTRHSLRVFDAREVARIETQMWKSWRS
jgi:hypothetical protein